MQDKIKRNEIIRDLLGCFDTIEELQRENEVLKNELSLYKSLEPVDGVVEVGNLDEAVMKVGREQILSKSTRSWCRSVRTYEEDDDTGESTVCPQSYESWLKEYVYTLPDEFSRNDFYAYFEPELRAIYDEEKAKAIAEATK